MPRPKVSVPKYGLHKPSGQAVCYVDRRMVCLGEHGSPASKKKFAEVIAARAAGLPVFHEKTRETDTAEEVPFSVNELCLKFASEQLPKYKTSDGQRSAECDCFLGVIRILRSIAGETPAAQFGPIRLRLAREKMIAKGWCRKFINKQVCRLRALFKFGVSWELVPSSVVESLKCVAALKPGDSSAPESQPRKAVPPANIEAAKKHLRQRNRDIVDLLTLTAARPGELLSLTTAMIDQTGEVWAADLAQHKTARHGHSRTIYFGAKAQAILAGYLKPLSPFAKLFPVQRKTLGTAVKDACKKAGVPPFTPHWLRHTAVTLIADEIGLEAAQRVAGHATSTMTLLYAAAAQKKAKDAVRKLG